MKKFFLVCYLGFCFLQFEQINAQKLVRNAIPSGICYAGDKVKKIYVPPPERYLQKAGQGSGAQITVYYSGFSQSSVNAFEYAVSILESILPADSKITIAAEWKLISSEGVLANSSIAGYAGGWGIDALDPYAVYPVALAEKILGEGLNDDTEADIILNFNSSDADKWYFGTDGNTPLTKFDFVTVVIHEICHGLGFFSSMYVEGDEGGYGAGQIPLIYDTFLETVTGSKLTDTTRYENPSFQLGRALTGGQLLLKGPLLSNFTSGEGAKIYAPSVWDFGSSIVHLDDEATLDINALMTPFIDRGEAIHDPGVLTMSILGDLGWINTRIIHEPSGDTEEPLTEIPVSLKIISDTTYKRDQVGIVYSYDRFTTSETLYLNSLLSDDTFDGAIPVPGYNSELEYYLFTEDSFSRVFRSPSLNKENPFRIYIGTDTVKPQVNHEPPEYLLEKVDSLRFRANVTDNIGIDTVYVEFKINDGISNYLGLKRKAADDYYNAISARTFQLQGNDTVFYRITALDSALVANERTMPSDGDYKIGIEEIGSVINSYSTNFVNASADFLLKGFEIIQPEGFSSHGLHSKHPYESPERNNDSIEYFAMLRDPVEFNQNGMMIDFREVVLVEPGETGSVFGSDLFYDYVVVEGSRDFGLKWFPLADGYDSRYLKLWESSYNNSLDDDFNSTFKGNESMLVRHTIFPEESAYFSPGDNLLIRFRLFSDPFANGWGWVIQDLKIGPLINDIKDHSIDDVHIYPNPGNGLVNLTRSEAEITEFRIKYSVYNSLGACLKTDYTGNGDRIIDISDMPEGFYIIILDSGNKAESFKYLLIK